MENSNVSKILRFSKVPYDFGKKLSGRAIACGVDLKGERALPWSKRFCLLTTSLSGFLNHGFAVLY